jgi:hypothetical protein
VTLQRGQTENLLSSCHDVATLVPTLGDRPSDTVVAAAVAAVARSGVAAADAASDAAATAVTSVVVVMVAVVVVMVAVVVAAILCTACGSVEPLLECTELLLAA